MSERAASSIGRPIDRVDGPAKVTGRAKYSAEFAPPGLCHAVIVQSTIPSGRIARIDARAAEAMPGVVLVLTHRNAPRLPQEGRAAVNPPAGREISVLQADAVRYNGEPIAVVVAQTLEQAEEAAAHVEVAYERRAAELDFERARSAAYRPAKMIHGKADNGWGDAAKALRSADVRIAATYTTPYEHHNPMEPHATVAQWEGERLTLWDSTQYVSGVRDTVAKTLGVPAENVRVLSPFVGGGFGCKGSTWSHVVLAAMAARAARRPVKLALERPQMFGPVGGRPRTEQKIELGAERDGRIVALRHDVVSHTSRFEDFTEPSTQPSRALYAYASCATTQRLVKLDLGTPTFQRAPGESTGTFAIECAMDELAYRLGMDPLDLRLRNHADVEPETGRPWSSKKLRECYEQAARRFDWPRRTHEPRSMRDGSWLVGWGMATATYPAHRMPSQASATLLPDGTVVVRSGTQDIGTGTYTVMTQVAAEELAIPVDLVRFELGDTRLPKAPISGGSMTVSSVGPAVQAACRELRALLERQDGEWLRAGDEDARRTAFRALARRQGQPLEAQGEAHPEQGDDKQPFAARSFGALFVEVRIDPELGIVRVPRIVASYSVGRLLNAKTGISQLQGGIVWGVGMALTEESLLDPATGRYVNENLAEYHVPVNADIGAIDVTVVDEDDARFNPLGIRGIGEIGITGVTAAIANAVYHATGKRVRDLPITLDKLL
ncbi:MAG TPA: xanthine dehydrogenase family protein molybdopterin-binding subunit [Usitatibacter sp.]|nr:xanthine dehydrogenase family protein molybdopterin-binding subunit [Usitatibacter sp.]